MRNCNRCGYANPDGRIVCLYCYYEVGAPYNPPKAETWFGNVKPVYLAAGGLCLVGLVTIVVGHQLPLAGGDKQSASARPPLPHLSPAVPTNPSASGTDSPSGIAPASQNPSASVTPTPQQTVSVSPPAREYSPSPQRQPTPEYSPIPQPQVEFNPQPSYPSAPPSFAPPGYQSAPSSFGQGWRSSSDGGSSYDTQRRLDDIKRKQDDIEKQMKENAIVIYKCGHCGATLSRREKDGFPSSSFDGGPCPENTTTHIHWWIKE